MKKVYSQSRPSVKRIRASLLVIALVLVCVLCAGCLKPPTTSDGGTSSDSSLSSVLYPADYYEGYWLCSGYELSGKTIALNNLSSEDKGSFPYLVLELGNSGGTLSQINNGDGDYRMLFGGDSRATGDGIRLVSEMGDLDLVLDGENLALQPEAAAALENGVTEMGLYGDYRLPQGEATYYFTRIGFDGQPQVVTFGFDDFTLDVPVDVGYALDGITPNSGDNGSISVSGTSYRRYGPHMVFLSWPTEAGNIVEVIAEAEGQDYCIEHADEFVEYGEVLYHLHHDAERNYSRLGFVRNGKLYEVDFDCEDEDSVDYSDYCEHFFTTIQFAGEAASEEQSDVPSNAISWQEAAQHVGETVTVYGPVADMEYASTSDGQPTFIDLGTAYPDSSRVTMVIWGEDRGNFPEPPEALYAGKMLCVTGEVYLYRGVCNIEVYEPSQVQIL